MERREVTRWAMYSWANHGWVTTVGTVLIGPWLLSLATSAAGSGSATLVAIGPLALSAAAYPSFMITVASLLQVVFLPMFGAAADARGHRRRLLSWTCGLGALISVLLATTGGDAWLYAGVLFLLGTIVFGATDVVYNSFLPYLVPPERRDWASGRGFALGYLGAGLLLALNLAMLQFHEVVGVDRETAVRLCFASAGVWWAGFGFWAIAGVREHGEVLSPEHRRPSRTGLRELRAVLAELRGMPQAIRFLIAFLFIADGVSAVTTLASTYITHEIFDSDASAAATFLFALILMIQFVAVGGSVLWARVSPRLGTKRTIMVMLVLWCGVVVYAYAAMRTQAEAVVLGLVIGLVIGGTQSLTRALFSQLIPRGRESAFFGLYAIVDKGTSWVAPLLFTVIVNATGSFRQAILSLILMFLVGIVVLARTDIDRARAEAVSTPPA
ncbi:MAG TPA: MFS transporter [Actinopolymorphaceae bacterium]